MVVLLASGHVDDEKISGCPGDLSRVSSSDATSVTFSWKIIVDKIAGLHDKIESHLFFLFLLLLFHRKIAISTERLRVISPTLLSVSFNWLAGL